MYAEGRNTGRSRRPRSQWPKRLGAVVLLAGALGAASTLRSALSVEGLPKTPSGRCG